MITTEGMEEPGEGHYVSRLSEPFNPTCTAQRAVLPRMRALCGQLTDEERSGLSMLCFRF